MLQLLRQDALRGEIVFDLLKRGQDGLPIAGNIGVVDFDVLIDGGTAQAGVEDGLRYGTSNRPEAAGEVEQVHEAGALETAGGAQGKVGIEGCGGDTDLGVRRGHVAFG